MAIEAKNLPWEAVKGCWTAAETPLGTYKINVSKDVTASIGKEIIFRESGSSGWEQNAILEAIGLAKEACRKDLTFRMAKFMADFAEPLDMSVAPEDNDIALGASSAIDAALEICRNLSEDVSLSEEERSGAQACARQVADISVMRVIDKYKERDGLENG